LISLEFNRREVVVLKKGKLLYEGKAKKLYETSSPDLLIQYFKDDATAFDGTKKAVIKNKGVINNKISSHIFQYLENYHIPTHFEKILSDREMLIKKLEIIPLEVVMRNIASGSLCKRYGIEEGRELESPILELYYKNDALHDPLMNEYHVRALGLATQEELDTISRMARKINAVLSSFFERRNLRLVDFKLEFGRYRNKILVGDEISPDTCRLWDMETGEKLDKDRFRFDPGDVERAYEEVYNRIFR